MRRFALFAAAGIMAAALAPASFADGRKPGSVLIYPIHRSGTSFFTVVSVTNVNVDPVNGGTWIQYDYVNVVANPQNNFQPLDCIRIDRGNLLTPADTQSVLTNCHNASFNGQEGYLVIHAQDPTKSKVAWSFNYLVGSELVVNAVGGIYSLNAVPFAAIEAKGKATDLAANGGDGDGQLDFNDKEYESLPQCLYIDTFLAVANSSLTLLTLSGGKFFTTTVRFDIWNDFEIPLSAAGITFRCWFEEPLAAISSAFTPAFLAGNTPNDPIDLDINCDQQDDFETGWAKITGQGASSQLDFIPGPSALVGAITAGPATNINGGHLLWETTANGVDGEFLNPTPIQN